MGVGASLAFWSAANRARLWAMSWFPPWTFSNAVNSPQLLGLACLAGLTLGHRRSAIRRQLSRAPPAHVAVNVKGAAKGERAAQCVP